MCAAQGLIYSKCGRTCANYDKKEEDIICEAGCFCPNGKLLDNGICIEQEDCPCMESGKAFTLGQSSPSDCSK